MLTVHKNTRAQRESKRLRKEIKAAVNVVIKLEGFSGYAIVAWNENFDTLSKWDALGSVVPGSLIPALVEQTLSRELAVMDIHDAMEGNI